MTQVVGHYDDGAGPVLADWDPAMLGTSDLVADRWRAWPFRERAGTADRPVGTIRVLKDTARVPSPRWSSTRTEPSRFGNGLLSYDGTEDEQDELSILQILAESGRADDFVKLADRITWTQRSAADLTRVVRLALTVGAHLFARHVAARGAHRYPDHPELQKMARILAPPQVVRRDLPPDRSWAANRAWLSAHAEEYRGQWVALKKGELLAAASTAREVRDAVDKATEVLIVKVS